MITAKQYWDTKKTCDHRYSPDEFFKSKAEESLLIIQNETDGEVENGVFADLGCGTGELLNALADKIKITHATDFSKSVLEVAKTSIGSKKIELIHANALEIASELKNSAWISTGACNQYMDQSEVEMLIDEFSRNLYAKELYLFDTIDFIRYFTLGLGVGYQDRGRDKLTAISNLRSKFNCLLNIIYFGMLEKDFYTFPSMVMGYGYMPRYWSKLCQKKGLSVNFYSSLYYEYRYHVVIKKI